MPFFAHNGMLRGSVAGWYLTQRFAPDTPGTQVFLAPGPEHVAIAATVSPWIKGRMVSIPARYWHRLLLALQRHASEAAAQLDSWSGSADPDDAGEHVPTLAMATSLVEPVRHLTARLRQGQELTDRELAQLGPYTHDDMAAMLDAVMLVVDAAVARGEPFSAWPE